MAQAVIDCGALDALVVCLEEFDPSVKEAATWALGYIARHNGGTRNINIYVGHNRVIKQEKLIIYHVHLPMTIAEKRPRTPKTLSNGNLKSFDYITVHM